MENQINRPYLAFDSILSEALQHTLPQIIPPAHDEDAQYPLPSVVFRMFDYTDVPEVQHFVMISQAQYNIILKCSTLQILR